MLLTATEVIEVFFKRLNANGQNKITETKLYRLAKKGGIPSMKLDGRVYFDEDTLRDWFRQKCTVNTSTDVLQRYGRLKRGD